MAIIYSYPQISTVNSGDLLIITDVSNPANSTRSVTVSALANFITTTGTGTGTTDYIVKWNDGPSGIIGDSLMIERTAAGVFPGNYIEVSGTGGLSTQNLEINADLFDSVGAPGAVGEVLSSLGAGNGIQWVAAGGAGTVTSVGIAADNGPGTGITGSGTFTFTGGTNVTTNVVGNTVTINSSTPPSGVTDITTATGISTGDPISPLAAATGSVTITSNAYAGTTNVGYVPTGGDAITFLRGDGTWVTPTPSALPWAFQYSFVDGILIQGENPGTTTTNNTGLGLGCLANLGAAGGSNTAMGYQAGQNLATSAQNVAIGSGALSTETAQGYNVAVGYQALNSLATLASGWNVAVGFEAGENIVTAVQSTYVGAKAGKGTAGAGNFNTGIGYSALSGISSGDSNVAVGTGAMTSAVTGSENVCIGNLAGEAMTSGFENVVIGHDAGKSIIGASNNVIVGANASENINSGSDNVVIGQEAGDALTIEAKNTIVGQGAGFLATSDANTLIGRSSGASIVTGGGNICIGNGSDVAAAADSNCIVIGNGTSAHGSNTVIFGNTSCTVWEPDITDQVDLGSATYSMKDYYASGNLNLGLGTSRIGIGNAYAANTKGAVEVNAFIDYNGSPFDYYLYGPAPPGTFSAYSGPDLFAISYWGVGRFMGSGIHIFSDERSKIVHGVSNSENDLKIINEIEITDFNYIDPVKGSGNQKKVIAQQVEKVYPSAVSLILSQIFLDKQN